MTEYISQTKLISAPNETIFAKLSDLSNLEGLDKTMSDQRLKLVSYDTDSCVISLGAIGQVALRIVERELFKTIKMETERSIIPFNLWIQLVESPQKDTHMRIVMRAELNALVRKTVGGRIEDAVNKLADVLAKIPY